MLMVEYMDTLRLGYMSSIAYFRTNLSHMLTWLAKVNLSVTAPD